MYVLSIQCGKATDLLACSNNIDKLHERMRDEVLGFISNVYYNDEEALEWLMPVRDDMNFWTDEDEEYPTTFRIEFVDEI
jgi:hypothetical protein